MHAKMEGLIPFVIKVIKRKNTQRSYECLSTDHAKMFNVSNSTDDTNGSMVFTEPIEKLGGGLKEEKIHRRRMSMPEIADDLCSIELGDYKLRRQQRRPEKDFGFRSYRERVFACMGGDA